MAVRLAVMPSAIGSDDTAVQAGEAELFGPAVGSEFPQRHVGHGKGQAEGAWREQDPVQGLGEGAAPLNQCSGQKPVPPGLGNFPGAVHDACRSAPSCRAGR